MVININNLNKNHHVHQNKNADAGIKQQAAQAAQTHTNQVRRDSVSLTPQAKQLAELQKKAIDAPVINQEKIEELKKAIISGDYKINTEKLAASIADFEFNLI